MGKKLNKVYDALVEGATTGYKGSVLYDYVQEHSPKSSSKRIVKASLFALTDPDVRDRDVLEAIYELAINYRLSSLGVEEDMHEADDDDGKAPEISKKLKTKLESSASKPAVLPATDISLPTGEPVH